MSKVATVPGATDVLLKRAAAVIPNGVSSAGRASWREMVVRAQGAYVWNAEGRRFVDYQLAWGPIVIGHCDPRVNDAVARTIATCDLNAVGPQLGEVELAETICELVPSAEMIAFCTSGTDATLHAVHLARAATGRQRLLKFHGSYHGWHDNLAVGSRFAYGSVSARRMDEPNSAGLHPGPVADVSVVEWNDLEGVRREFTERGPEFAAVFSEPYVHSYGCVPPAPGFLEELRELCTRNGSVLVFDEIKTGFRASLGGYQAVCGVTPDLTVFGKAVANGFSLAGIAGRRALMEHLGAASETSATLDGSYNASPYALAAARATIEILRAGGTEHIVELGARMRAGLTQAIQSAGARASVAGFGSEWTVYFRPEPPRNYNEAIESNMELGAAFTAGLFAEGVLEPQFVIGDRRLCVATTEADVDMTVETAGRVLAAISKP
jgi:glutamate-1-semialdehyde 2,1-aminomutase